MRALLVILFISLITSCVSRHESKDSINYFMSQGMSAKDAREAYEAMHRTELLVYPATTSWSEDSVFIDKSELHYAVQEMIQCPPLKNSYSLRKDVLVKNDGLHIVANRANCSVDMGSLKEYVDNQIRENRVKAEKRFTDEQQRVETDPVGPFTIGCEDYKRRFRGENILTINHAIKTYKKIKREYVTNLYNLGFNAAKYSAVNVDCSYLYQLHFNGITHRYYY